ncbi:MAG TPA: nucleotidyltransferase domain-containing protein [Kiritimatiellia bacterium]|nr:nucleotidyltransferase domain-containing protein [Kiritimatiellia bacterium]HMO98655.1 nucleotidyltransferase domain-containing protein [Kiritimatiellia bacterium]HMP90850.1 nucleotidyltransferase domain-containing protein [Kiritimatiellia bacterium]
MARPASIDIHAARKRLEEREAVHKAKLDRRYAQAARDAAAIIELLAKRYRPLRIYQWGSLINRRHFNEHSDIDIAVEGATDSLTFFQMHRDAEAMTSFPLDLVEIDKIEPEFASIIRMKGKLVYERVQ